jgi:hypothetical protein
LGDDGCRRGKVVRRGVGRCDSAGKCRKQQNYETTQSCGRRVS